MTTAMKSRKELIKAATVNRVVSKSGEFLGYLVKSNSNENYYQVTWNESQKCYECNCAAKVKCCCHVKAISEVCQARLAIQKAAQEQSKKERWVAYKLSCFFQALYVYAEQQVKAEQTIQVLAANPEIASLVKVAPKPAIAAKTTQPSRYDAPLRGSGATGFGVQARLSASRKIANGVPMR